MAPRRHRPRPSLPPRPDIVLLISVAVLVALGIVELASTSSAKVSFNGLPISLLFRKHITRVLAGCLGLLVAAKTDPERWQRYAKWMLIISFLLLLPPALRRLGVDLHLVCDEKNGAYRALCFGSFSFMPGEFVKVSFILWLAHFLSIHQRKPLKGKTFVIPLGMLGLAVLLLLFQPSFSTSLGLATVALLLLFIAGVRKVALFGIVLSGLLVMTLLTMGSEYRSKRVNGYGLPWKLDPMSLPYHPRESLIGLGHGWLIGAGIGQGRQKYGFLPEIHTDYPLAVVGEEMGFLGTSLVVLLFGVILYRGGRIALASSDRFRFLLAAGLTLNITIFAMINAGVTTALVPTTGQSLPFLSYGGAATMVNLVSIGMLDSVHRSNP